MDAAKAAINKITSRHGHTTDVDEVVNPAVTRETVKPHQHEETTKAIDREVHQDHYHTTVQPVAAREQLPEKHIHNQLPTQEKEYHHGNHSAIKEGVQAELGQFRDSSVVQPTTHSSSAAATVAGEHVHHHVHETVQPVVHKETIQPEVVHTTAPVHEVHHAEAQHHGVSALPMKSIDEFSKAGGILKGTTQPVHEHYEGAPRPYNEKLGTTVEKALGSVGIGSHNNRDSGVSGVGTSTGHHTTGTGIGGHNTTGSGIGSGIGGHNTTGSGIGSGIGHDNTSSGIGGHHSTGTGIGSGIGGHNTTGSGIGSGIGGHNTTGSGIGSGIGGHNTTGSGIGGHNTTGSGIGGTDGLPGRHTGSGIGSSDNYNDRSTGVGNNSSTHKPSLMDKLNPKVDADGDGKPGFMK